MLQQRQSRLGPKPGLVGPELVPCQLLLEPLVVLAQPVLIPG